MSSLSSKYEFVQKDGWCVVCKRGSHQLCKGKNRIKDTGELCKCPHLVGEDPYKV